MQSAQRPFSAAERSFLEQGLAKAPGTAKRWQRGAENALVLWASSLLVLILVWFSLAWVVRKLSGLDFGIQSPVAIWLITAALPICTVVAVISSVRWVQGWRDPRPLLQADLAGGCVIEERYRFTASKRFQELEHGGLIYLFLTDDGKVFTRYDHESQDLGVQDKDPLSSSFEARAELMLIRAPNTRYVIGETASGDLLDTGPIHELAELPQRWPNQDEYCDMPWSELEARLSKI